jgi:hypothetical protein
MYKICSIALLATAVLWSGATAAPLNVMKVVHLGKNSTVTRKDGRMILEMSPANGRHYTPPPRHDGLITIYSDFAYHYPDSLYFCCEGLLVTGPSAFPGFFPEFQEAAAFTSDTTRLLTEIDVALSYSSGTNGADISLYSGQYGLPAVLLKTWHVTNIPISASCCTPTVVKSRKGIPIQAGGEYWVAVSAGKKAPDANLGWMLNTTEQIYAIRQASWCSDDISQSGSCGDLNDVWTNSTSPPSPAFAVYGK